MQIQLNDKEVQLNENGNLLQFLVQQQIADKKGIAVAVNNTVIPRAQWHQFIIAPSSHITVFTASQGG